VCRRVVADLGGHAGDRSAAGEARRSEPCFEATGEVPHTEDYAGSDFTPKWDGGSGRE